MKRIGILFGMLVLSAGMVLAQDNSGNSGSNTNDNAAQNTTTTTPSDQATDNAHKRAAVRNENAADAAKQDAKEAGTKTGEEHDKAVARLDDSAKDLNELLAAPDDGIPEICLRQSEVRSRGSVNDEGRLHLRCGTWTRRRLLPSCQRPVERARLLHHDRWQLGGTDRRGRR